MKKDLVSVIFPTRNRKQDLIKCIKSIKESTHKKIEIVILDNGSTDGSQETVKELFPEVILIESELNLGIPIAYNKCVRKSKGEFILRLDDDIILEKDTIEKMLRVLKSSHKIGAVGSLLLYTEEPDTIRSNGMSMFMFIGKTKIHDKNKKYNNNFKEKNIERQAVGGGTIMIKRGVLNEINLFAEEYFLMYEDVDLCFRIRKAGYKIILVGSAKMYHSKQGGMAQKENSLRVYLNERSRVLFMKKFAGWKNLIFFPYLFTFLYPAKALRFLFKKNIPAMKSLTKAVYDALFDEKVFVYTQDGKQIPYVKDKIST